MSQVRSAPQVPAISDEEVLDEDGLRIILIPIQLVLFNPNGTTEITNDTISIKHTTDRRAARTEAELLTPLNSSSIKGASSFRSIDSAIQFTRRALQLKKFEIRTWAKGARSGSPTRAAGFPPIRTDGSHEGRMGPPT